MLTDFSNLPDIMRNEAVRVYYDLLNQKRGALVLKRIFDLFVSAVALVVLSPVFLLTAAAVKLDSRGPVFFRQPRYTRDMRVFRILKFRTMVTGADRQGPLVTVADDRRVTRVGAFLRRTRLDEIPQLINILIGDMSFVGTRPEVERYVRAYTDEMLATLLMPAGVTSKASIAFKDEAVMLAGATDIDRTYIDEVLPLKMQYNLEYIRNFRMFSDIRLMLSTLFAVSQPE